MWLIDLIYGLLGFPVREHQQGTKREQRRELFIRTGLFLLVIVVGLALWFLLPEML